LLTQTNKVANHVCAAAHRIIEILGQLAGCFICSADAMGQGKADIRARS
jgi:hypothetical protein